MGVAPPVLLVVYGAQAEVGLQLAVRALYLTDQVVIVPCGLFVQLLAVGAQEVDAAQAVDVLRHGNAPLYVAHVFRVLLVAYIVYDVVFRYGRVLADGPALRAR